MLFGMGQKTQRFISSFTAAMMLLTSVACLCGGAPVPPGLDQHAYAAKEQCHSHAQTYEANHCKQERSPEKEESDHSCDHCRSTLVLGTSTSQTVTHLLHLSQHALVSWTPNIHLSVPILLNTNHFLSDLPPPVGPPTLLSLSCALNT